MTWKTNSEYWKDLLNGGCLFSYVKDGTPHTFWMHLLGFAYPLFLFCIIIFAILFMRMLPPSQRKWKSYFFAICCGTIIGGIGCLLPFKYNSQFPGWLFPPWAVTGIEYGLTLEDWLFLPSCTTLFYIFYRYINLKTRSTPSPMVFHYYTVAAYCVLSVFVCIFTKTAGRLEILLYVVPGVFLYWFARDCIVVKAYLILQIVVIAFQSAWDLTAVSALHLIPGMSWCSQWIYISFDNAGNYFHSPIFMDYGTHRWAWILFNPIEMTPLMGICGGILNCAMFAAGDKMFYAPYKKA